MQNGRNAQTQRLVKLMWAIVDDAIGTRDFHHYGDALDHFTVSKGLRICVLGLEAPLDIVRLERFSEMVSGSDYSDRIRFAHGAGANPACFSDH